MHTNIGSILIHGDLLQQNKIFSHDGEKSSEYIKCSVRRKKGPGVNIRIVVRTDTKTCEMNRYVSVTLNVCDC